MNDPFAADPNMVPDENGQTPLDISLTHLAAVKNGNREALSRGMATVLLAEFERMRSKLEDISKGKSTMILSDAARALPVTQLPDEDLLAWVRPALAFIAECQSRVADKKEDSRPAETLSGMYGVIGLAKMAMAMGAGEASFTAHGITDKGKEMGDWKVIVREAKPDEVDVSLTDEDLSELFALIEMVGNVPDALVDKLDEARQELYGREGR